MEFPQSIKKMYAPCHSCTPTALWELNVKRKKTHQLLGECQLWIWCHLSTGRLGNNWIYSRIWAHFRIWGTLNKPQYLFFTIYIVQNPILITKIFLPHWMQFYIHVRGTWCKKPFGTKLNKIKFWQFEVKRTEVASNYCKAQNTQITTI